VSFLSFKNHWREELKLTKEEFQRIDEESALELFRQEIRAEDTREKYTRTLKLLVMDFLEEFFDGNPKATSCER